MKHVKLRHARAIAVFGIAVLALTGARGSHGGGCDNSSSGSSSSSGGSGSHSDNDNDSNATSGGSLPGGGSSADKAARDVTIDKCAYDAATKKLTAKITVRNDGALDYDYSVTMKFTGAGATAATAVKTGIAVTAGSSVSTELTTPYPGTGDGSEYTKCEVSRASRI
ncbi:hypothetical protein ACFCZV_18995 [Streptomyces hydrogenans]|uniref:hypothetical protein n=1 Tax=Streptomyces hydrogenans TaxID=1873719 RepID=UPI0035D8AC65